MKLIQVIAATPVVVAVAGFVGHAIACGVRFG
jgi:hypothetical protein